MACECAFKSQIFTVKPLHSVLKVNGHWFRTAF